jgi:hypothetical protein
MGVDDVKPSQNAAPDGDALQLLRNVVPLTHGRRPTRMAILQLSGDDPKPICNFFRRGRSAKGNAHAHGRLASRPGQAAAGMRHHLSLQRAE